jgi:cyclic-di-GMP-binding protein
MLHRTRERRLRAFAHCLTERAMSNFDLPITSGDSNPEFRDASSCAEWLQSLPLINAGPSHGRLLGQLEELNCCDVPVAERMRILELLREPIMFVQGEHGKTFTARALPLAPGERAIFANVLALWNALAYGWQRCLQSLDAGAPGLSTQAALICERMLWCIGQRMLEHYRAYAEISADEWRRAHQIYAYAESRGAADREVPHPEHKGELATSCAETYAHILLTALANPNEHTPRQQALAARWIDRWARKMPVSTNPPADTGMPLSVDLESGAGASREAKAGPGIRFLHIAEAGRSIRKRLVLLHSGESPEALGLGSDVSPGLASQMLRVLHSQWCEDKNARQHVRRPGKRHAQVCSGIATVHYYLTGKAFRQPAAAVQLTQRQRDEIATFGRTSFRVEDDHAASQASALEHWELYDESLNGFRLERPRDGGRSRFVHNQLVAVRPSDARTFILSSVRWLAVTASDELRMGIRLLPGVPHGIALRLTGVNARNEKYVPALALPSVPALQTAATLVIPAGWYRARRVLEVHRENPEQLMLSGLVERGSDYELCTFEPA